MTLTLPPFPTHSSDTRLDRAGMGEIFLFLHVGGVSGKVLPLGDKVFLARMPLNYFAMITLLLLGHTPSQVFTGRSGGIPGGKTHKILEASPKTTISKILPVKLFNPQSASSISSKL